MSREPVIVVDGDDTLWFVEPLYDAARDAAGQVVADTGLDPVRWDELQRLRDLANVTTMGFSPDRFPLSAVEAYRALAAETGANPTAATEHAVDLAARAVFTTPAPLAADCHQALDRLRDQFRLVLLTKGDQAVQEQRITDSGLAKYFDLISIVSNKAEPEFRAVLAALDAEPTAAWSIGNSLPSDINPALRLGMSAVWVDAHVWEHERRDVTPHVGRLLIAETLAEGAGLMIADLHPARG